jgi:hypothetical protein
MNDFRAVGKLRRNSPPYLIGRLYYSSELFLAIRSASAIGQLVTARSVSMSSFIRMGSSLSIKG